MKIAVSGKGGVGKTTISAGLVEFLADKGYQVYAVDADPDVSLGTVLGLPEEELAAQQPIVDMREIIANKTGGKGAFFSLNPDVEDLLDEYIVKHGNIHFLKMGAIKQGGSSCYCRENSVLNAMVGSLFLKRNEAVLMDMGAGIEHLTRGTAKGVDLMLVVTEPSKVSVQTSKVVQGLAAELGVSNVKIIGNKIRNDKEKEFLYSNFSEEDIIGVIEFNEAILDKAMGLEVLEPQTLNHSISVIGNQILQRVGE